MVILPPTRKRDAITIQADTEMDAKGAQEFARNWYYVEMVRSAMIRVRDVIGKEQYFWCRVDPESGIVCEEIVFK